MLGVNCNIKLKAILQMVVVICKVIDSFLCFCCCGFCAIYRMRKQAERWGAELFHEDVEFVDVKNRPFIIRSSEREVKLYLGYQHIL